MTNLDAEIKLRDLLNELFLDGCCCRRSAIELEWECYKHKAMSLLPFDFHATLLKRGGLKDGSEGT